MNINELDSFDLADAVKFNDELNPRIWQGSRMRPEVRKKLLAIARDFKQSLGLTDLEVKDITVSGSNAGYTYTPHSDIDLHLVVDIPQADSSEVYRELFNAKKYQYNDEHNLAIGGYPVELYVENANEPPVSQGMFSVLNNDWINIPRKRKSTVNDNAVKSKYELMKHRIESAIDSGDLKRLTKTAARIKQMRQAGLDKNGELGPENLAYKILRTQGLIEKLYTARTAAKDHQLSLQERKKKKSRVRYGFGSYWAPVFSFSSEAGEGGGDGGGGESVGEDATISPYGVNPTTQMFLNETDGAEQTVRDFIEHAADRLGIERLPEIKLHTDPEWSEREHSFGRYTPETHTLEVNLANRHIMDILRTTAHELVHCRQHELSPLPDEAGATGSRWENEAHAKAGVLMRDYADANPDKFGETSLAEASGYIPTKAQAKDPRFSTALSVDVHPGQTGREANKMALQTDSQGRPALLIKGLANQLHEEFSQFDETTALFEIKMTGKNLRAEAAKTGAIAGMEFEMIVPNVENDDDDDGEQEPDWDQDESVVSIDDACDFFENDANNSPGDIRRLRANMQEEYWEWLGEQFDSRWDSDEEEFVYDYLKENASAEEIAEILGYGEDGDGYPEPDRQAYRDATERVVEQGYGNYWYDAAREAAQEDYNSNADSEREWLEDRDINTMRDVMDTFGNVGWPYYYYSRNSGGDRSIEDVANDFQDAIGRDVSASTGYHSRSVERPGPSSHHYVVEPDGSLEGDEPDDRGLEFVSPPLPIDVILNDLNKVKRWAKAYGCYTNDSTGLHINISVPNYSRDNLDFVKLAILMGDEYVSKSFGRLGAFYAKSAMGMIRDNIRSRPEAVEQALAKMRTHLDTAASKTIHSGVTTKYTSINVKDGHIEFRSPGGDWLDENFDKIENTLLRFTVALSAATNPEMYREEYLKKLYKLLNPEGIKDEYGDMIEEFSKYMVSLQGGNKESGGKLSKETQQAIKDFRKVAAQELRQKNLATRLKKGDTGGQKYWWDVSWGNGRVEVVASTKEQAIDNAFLASYWAPEDDHTPQAIQFRNSLRAKPLSPYYEKSKPSVWKVYGSNSSPYQRLGVEVVATDEFEAMQKARQKWNLNIGQSTEQEWFRDKGWSAERIGEAPAEQTPKYEIYNKQTGNKVEDADGITNDADALVRLNDYIEHGPHALQRGQASRMFGIRTTSGVEIVGLDIPMAEPRAQTSPTGQWKIIDGLGREVYRFRPAVNTRAKANELAAVWAREYNWDGNYQVEPAEDNDRNRLSQTDIENRLGWGGQADDANYEVVDRSNNQSVFKFIANTEQEALRKYQQVLDVFGFPHDTENYGYRELGQTGATPDQRQGGLIDVAGSTNDLARQRATPGTFTGAWRVLDADGNELYRFSGIGNSQSDANRVAVQWMRDNGYEHGTDMTVVPVMSEGVAEGVSNSSQTVTRIDSQPIKDFTSNLKSYKHVDDWSQSGIDTGDDSYWKNKNLKTNTTKGLFAGDPHRTALYATGNAHETRYVEYTENGQPVVYFDQKDLPKMRSRKTYLTVFDASNFRKLPTGEYFSENPGQPLTQTEIRDPFQYIASQGWIVRVTPDLNKVFKQVQSMHRNGKIQQYGAEGMSESIAESMPQPSQGQGKYRDLNKPLGPETPPKMPAGTIKVDVSDMYDWYKLGQKVSDLSSIKPGELGSGPPSTVFAFGSEDLENQYSHELTNLGLKTHDLDEPGEEDIDEASLANMRDFFSGNTNNQTSKKNSQQLQIQKVFRSPEEYAQWVKQNRIVNAPRINEEPEFYSMPLRMSEYRGKEHPGTKEPYDAKFKYSGDLKARVHSMLDAGTKPTVMQVNPRHLLATQDWLSSQGGGKPAFATMKQRPVVLQKNNKMYILDGHHRSADALKSGTPIEVYLFRDEL